MAPHRFAAALAIQLVNNLGLDGCNPLYSGARTRGKKRQYERRPVDGSHLSRPRLSGHGLATVPRQDR